MKYFKIQFGFNEIEYLPITGDELPKAMALFMEKNGRAVFESGAIRGQDIMRIVPDWHKVKGWNQGYRMTEEDFAEVEAIRDKYDETLSKARAIAEFAIKENRRELLSKPPLEAIRELPEKTIKQKELSEETKKLVNKFNTPFKNE